MAAVVLICAGLLGFSPPDQSEYQAAAARAGRDAGAHLKLAVWCEAHGMDAERLKHLAVALAIDPQNAAARGLLGLVALRRKMAAAREGGRDREGATRPWPRSCAEYEGKRQATPDTAEAQWQLGLWCEKNGLKAEAMAHFTAVTQIDPNRADAWHKLGCAVLQRPVDQRGTGRRRTRRGPGPVEGGHALGAVPQAVEERPRGDGCQARAGHRRAERGHRPARRPVDPQGPRPRQSRPAGDGRR